VWAVGLAFEALKMSQHYRSVTTSTAIARRCIVDLRYSHALCPCSERDSPERLDEERLQHHQSATSTTQLLQIEEAIVTVTRCDLKKCGRGVSPRGVSASYGATISSTSQSVTGTIASSSATIALCLLLIDDAVAPRCVEALCESVQSTAAQRRGYNGIDYALRRDCSAV